MQKGRVGLCGQMGIIQQREQGRVRGVGFCRERERGARDVRALVLVGAWDPGEVSWWTKGQRQASQNGEAHGGQSAVIVEGLGAMSWEGWQDGLNEGCLTERSQGWAASGHREVRAGAWEGVHGEVGISQERTTPSPDEGPAAAPSLLPPGCWLWLDARLP